MRALFKFLLAMLFLSLSPGSVRGADVPFVDGNRPPNALELQADAEAKMAAYEKLASKAPALAAAWQNVIFADRRFAAARVTLARLERQPDIWSARIEKEKEEVAYWADRAYYYVWSPAANGWIQVTNFQHRQWKWDHSKKLQALEAERARHLRALAGARKEAATAHVALQKAMKAYGDLLAPYQKEFAAIWAVEYRNRKAALIYKRESAQAAWAARKAVENPHLPPNE